MEDVKMIYVTGQSGKKYRFYSFKSCGHFKKAGGVYILTNKKQDQQRTVHQVIHIGETEDLSSITKKYTEDELDCRKKANCVCAKMVEDHNERIATFRDIKRKYHS
jgi:hypothetical protein